MKTKNIFALAALGLLGLSACSNTNDPLQPSEQDDVVRFTVAINKGSASRTVPESDIAEEQQKFTNIDTFTFGIVNGQATNTTNYYYTGSDWTLKEGNQPLTWGNEPSAHFFAHLPSIEYGASMDSYTLRKDQHTSKSDLLYSDYMTYEANVNKTNVVNIKFTRRTARVVVNIVKLNDGFGEEHQYQGEPVALDMINDVKIGCNTVVKRDETTQLYGGETPGQIMMYMIKGAKFVALVAPMTSEQAQTHAEEAFLSINMNLSGYSQNLGTLKGLRAMEAGKSYTYNVSLGKKGVTIESVTVTPWTEIDGGKIQAEEVKMTASMSQANSRAAHTDTKSISNFGVAIQAASGSATYGTDTYNNVKFSAQDVPATTWNPASPLLWQKGVHTVNLVAYAPFKEGLTDLFNLTDMPFSVEASQTAESFQSDLLISKVAGHDPIANPVVNVPFRHAMSQLVVEITCPQSFTKEQLDAFTSITVNGTKLEATCNLTKESGFVTPTATAPAPITVAKSGTSGNKLSFAAVIVPQTVANGNLLILFKIGELDYTWLATQEYTFAENTSYKLTLSLKDNQPATTSRAAQRTISATMQSGAWQDYK